MFQENSPDTTCLDTVHLVCACYLALRARDVYVYLEVCNHRASVSLGRLFFNVFIYPPAAGKKGNMKLKLTTLPCISYMLCVNLTQLHLQSRASWRILRFLWQ